MAKVAEVAEVAKVAQVAEVAEVAEDRGSVEVASGPNGARSRRTANGGPLRPGTRHWKVDASTAGSTSGARAHSGVLYHRAANTGCVWR